MGVHGHNTRQIFQKFNKIHYFCYSPLNCGWLLKNSKTLWNRKYNHWGIHGKYRYISGNIWKSIWILLVGYRENLNWWWHAVYLQGVSGRSLCTWSANIISGTRPPGNEWPSWSDIANIANYCTLNYGECTGFWRIYTFWINVKDWSHITCPTNKTLSKSVRWTKNATKTGNWNKTFSIKPMCFILSMRCTKGNCTCLHKVIKYASSTTKTFLWYICWNPTTSKRVPHICT